MSIVIFLINLPVCTLIAMGGRGVYLKPTPIMNKYHFHIIAIICVYTKRSNK